MSFTQIMIIAVLALVLLGPDQLPDAAKKFGKAVRMLRQVTDGFRSEMAQFTEGDGADTGLGALRDLHTIATDAASLVRTEVRALTNPNPAPKVRMAAGTVPAVGLADAPGIAQANLAETTEPPVQGELALSTPAQEPSPRLRRRPGRR